MDSFFISCELLSKPDLRDKPCCVGGNMISTSNYLARKYGVRSAMAGWVADVLVEELSGGTEKLIHVPSNFELYREQSNIMSDVLRQYDPQCRCMSLDEAFLDFGPYLALRLSNKDWSHEQIKECMAEQAQNDNNPNTAEEQSNQLDAEATLQTFSSRECLDAASGAISAMRQKVYEATEGLTCSAGLAPNFVVAKIASDCNKPNGQKIIGPELDEAVLPFLRPMSTRKVPGIGRVTQKMLQAFSITTVQHLYDERALVRFLFHSASAKSLLKAAMGGFGQSASSEEEDEKANQSNVKRKGISHERTFSPGETWLELNCRLEDIARMLAKDMKKEGIWARTISLKIKQHTFDVLQRSRSMGKGIYLQDGDDLLSHAAEMLRELRKEHKGNRFLLRLMGIRCSNLVDDAEKAVTTANQQIMENFLVKGTSVSPKGSAPTLVESLKERKPPAQARGLALDSPKEDHFFKPHFQNASTNNTDACTNATPVQGLPPLQVPSPWDKTTQRKRKDLDTCSKENDSLIKERLQQQADCPICNRAFEADSQEALNMALNTHIDSCLNGQIIRQAVQEESQRAGQSKRVKRGRSSSSLAQEDQNNANSSTRKTKMQCLTKYFA
jgi:DNA polymerase kappa